MDQMNLGKKQSPKFAAATSVNIKFYKRTLETIRMTHTRRLCSFIRPPVRGPPASKKKMVSKRWR